jgi:hypothetical protein
MMRMMMERRIDVAGIRSVLCGARYIGVHGQTPDADSTKSTYTRDWLGIGNSRAFFSFPFPLFLIDF